MAHIKTQFEKDGFAILDNCYTSAAVSELIQCIEAADKTAPTFRKTQYLFAIRQFLKEVPAAIPLIFTDALTHLIHTVMGSNYFVVKSIYFDKPVQSNWFVAFHQDLTISVAEKKEVVGFGPWTKKEGYFAVQPPLRILEDNCTIRIHLDDTTEENGALKVIPLSHHKGIYRPESIDFSKEPIVNCAVAKGGIMLMKPLLMHASGRTTNGNRRRVIHIEFGRSDLPPELAWAEQLSFC